jgi:hypothetical protein
MLPSFNTCMLGATKGFAAVNQMCGGWSILELDIYEVQLESSRIRSKKKWWHNLLNFGCHFLQNLLGNVYSDPIVFSTPQKHSGNYFP